MINPFKNKKGLGRGLSSLIGDIDIMSSNSIISIGSRTFLVTEIIFVYLLTSLNEQ